MERNSKKVLVTEIERGALHDGPGIRTTVFLAGCFLDCPWCCNPETKRKKIMLLHDKNKCIGCGNCVSACLSGAAAILDKKSVFDRIKCDGCGECIKTCPAGALTLSGHYMSPEEIIEQVVRDYHYYEASEGGLTLSGGEPFYQSKAALTILALAKEEGLHTVVETTANINKEIMKLAIPLVDLFLIDIKHSDANKLREIAGADLNIILNNIRMIVDSGADVWLRTPVIPGFNHDLESIRNIFELIKREFGISKSILLPYHSLGKSKYEQLSIPYPMGDARMLSTSDMEQYIELGLSIGMNIEIG